MSEKTQSTHRAAVPTADWTLASSQHPLGRVLKQSVVAEVDLLYSRWRQDLGFDMCCQQARSL